MGPVNASDPPTDGSAAGYWNEAHLAQPGGDDGNFMQHPLVRVYMSMRSFGEVVGQLDVVAAELRTRTQPGARIVSVGCGRATKERTLASMMPDRQFVGLDVADRVLEVATEEARAAGIGNLELRVADFNALELEADAYDALLGLGAIHHVEALEAFWAAAARGLKPDGVVLAQEYVGPSRFQWTEAQIEQGDRVLAELVPDAHKLHHRRVHRPSVAEMCRIDPSEAVRSAEILTTLKDAGFAVEGLAGAGGALLQPVLMNQIRTFDPADWSHSLVLARLFQEEDRLMREGVLGDDFVSFVARPPR